MLTQIISKIDYRLSSNAFSRPERQVHLLIEALKKRHPDKFKKVLDVGGGWEVQYKSRLKQIAKNYVNLEIKPGKNVDLVGTVYRLHTSADLITLFMVMEHLNDPLRALMECARILDKDGYVALTTVQYWHTHNHPSDYFRYTKAGLEYLCKQAGLKVMDIWSMGGPFLVVFHAIELNLSGSWRTLFSILFYRLFDWLDWIIFKHNDGREHSDSVGWSLIAKKA